MPQPLQRILPVPLLGAEPLGLDHQHPALGHPAASEAAQALLHGRRQQRRSAHIEPKAHSRGDLVDVLPTGARGAEELEANLTGAIEIFRCGDGQKRRPR
jgi:hypothetical protein